MINRLVDVQSFGQSILNGVARRLQKEGVSAFEKSFETLTGRIAEKREKLQTGWQPEMVSA